MGMGTWRERSGARVPLPREWQECQCSIDSRHMRAARRGRGSPARNGAGDGATAAGVHRVAVLALESVVAFDLATPAQAFRGPYSLEVCAVRRGPVPTSAGFSLVAD